jgi:hypothetical protein
MCFAGYRYMDIIKNKYLNDCIKELVVEIRCRMLCCEDFTLSLCVLLSLAEGVCAAVLVGRVAMEMHRCWDVLGLVESTGLCY